MKKVKSLVAVVMLCAICLSLCGCGIVEKSFVGTWSGEYEYNGNHFSRAFVLDDDGNYTEVTLKNGSLHDTETGTYEVKGTKLLLHENGDTDVSTPYKIRLGKLVNNGHEFTKVD
ncbi:MAG: hypothetical protein IIX84_01825 [Oscillospiraceae bacterium]|nr:hypothetical protein [Oscillospiraceae bacterium]